MCLGNSVFDGVFGVSITTAKFAPEDIKFCCNCVGVENSVSEVKGYQLERLFQDERRNAKFNHCRPPLLSSPHEEDRCLRRFWDKHTHMETPCTNI